jgi:hypothetical protein
MSDGRFAGVDWASEEHAVCVVDERGRILEGRRDRHTEDTTADPGSTQDPVPIVYDIDEAREDPISRGVDISEMSHYDSRPFHSVATETRGSNPEEASEAAGRHIEKGKHVLSR